MTLLIPLLLAVATLQAAVDGIIRNGTTGKPQPGATVTLVTVGNAGMQPQGSVKSGPDGRFRFEQTPQSMTLVQAAHQGVTYTLMVQPGAPTSGLTLDVYDASPRAGAAKVAEDVAILEPSGSQLVVRQNVIWQNGGKVTFRDPAGGTLRFYAPQEAKDSIRVSATPPNGLPLEQAALPAGEPGVYKVDFAIKPGDTTFEVSYTVPLSTPATFAGRTLQKDSPLRLAVPSGVTLAGEGLTLLGQDPQSKASVYSITGQDYKVEIQGTGSLANAAPAAEEGSDSGLNQILPRVYDNVWQIVGLSLAVLALGFVLLFRRKATTTTAKVHEPAEPGSRRRR